MNSKLTLRLNKDIIEGIKAYAFMNRRSLSSITEDLYKKILMEKEKKENDIKSPIAKKYKGILGGEKIDTASIKLEYLNEKHLI